MPQERRDTVVDDHVAITTLGGHGLPEVPFWRWVKAAAAIVGAVNVAASFLDSGTVGCLRVWAGFTDVEEGIFYRVWGLADRPVSAVYREGVVEQHAVLVPSAPREPQPGGNSEAGRATEDRRAALVERLGRVLMPPLGGDVREWPGELADLYRSMPGGSMIEWIAAVEAERRRMDAEAVLALLESGEAGVTLVPVDELERLREHAHICSDLVQANEDLGVEAVKLRAQVAQLLPYAWAGAEALDFQEPYGPPSTGGDVYREGAEAMLTRIKSGEFGPLPGGAS